MGSWKEKEFGNLRKTATKDNTTKIWNTDMEHTDGAMDEYMKANSSMATE